MAWTFVPDKPVFIQIGERIRKSIVSGEYPLGSQIPTVRQIALDATVNPNTVVRALAFLEAEGLIFSKSTLGKYVTEDKSLIDRCREKMALKLTDDYISGMKELGVSEKEAIELLSKRVFSDNSEQ